MVDIQKIGKELKTAYRPRRFDQMRGPGKQAAEEVAIALGNNHGSLTSHTHVFTGYPGTGKTTLAFITAASLNCTSLQESDIAKGLIVEPCGKCKNCKAIFGLTRSNKYNPSVTYMNSVKLKLDDVRKITEDFMRSDRGNSFIGEEYPTNILIFEEAHNLGTKSLEMFLEPMEKLSDTNKYFFFISTKDITEMFDKASRSRITVHQLPNWSPGQIEQMLSYIVKLENTNTPDYKLIIEPEAMTKLALASEGIIRTGLELIQKIIDSSYNKKDKFIITPEMVDKYSYGLTGSIKRSVYEQALEMLELTKIQDLQALAEYTKRPFGAKDNKDFSYAINQLIMGKMRKPSTSEEDRHRYATILTEFNRTMSIIENAGSLPRSGAIIASLVAGSQMM